MAYQNYAEHGVCTGTAAKEVAQKYPSHIKPLPTPRMAGIGFIPNTTIHRPTQVCANCADSSDCPAYLSAVELRRVPSPCSNWRGIPEPVVEVEGNPAVVEETPPPAVSKPRTTRKRGRPKKKV